MQSERHLDLSCYAIDLKTFVRIVPAIVSVGLSERGLKRALQALKMSGVRRVVPKRILRLEQKFQSQLRRARAADLVERI